MVNRKFPIDSRRFNGSIILSFKIRLRIGRDENVSKYLQGRGIYSERTSRYNGNACGFPNLISNGGVRRVSKGRAKGRKSAYSSRAGRYVRSRNFPMASTMLVSPWYLFPRFFRNSLFRILPSRRCFFFRYDSSD